MDDYKYKNKYEQEETQMYEGTYSYEEIELNRKLLEECSKESIDFSVVEDLLKKGADPNGGTAEYGWGLLDHVYGELVMDSQNNDSVNLPRITELFLKYGMDIANPRVPYDGSNSLNPMWDYAFVCNENAIVALKMLLDYGLPADHFEEFWGHAMIDFFYIQCGDPQNDALWNYDCTWAFKMLLLGASYNHILENDKGLKTFICYDYNTYDVHKFRDWDQFEYYFDTSHCDRGPELYKSILHIYKNGTKNEVWKIGVGIDDGRALDELLLKKSGD